MTSMRAWIFTGIGFVIGLALTLGLLSLDLNPPGGPVVVRAYNVGTHEALARFELDGSERWEWTLAPGSDRERRFEGPYDQVVVKVRVTWSDSLGQRSGEATLLPDTSRCDGAALAAFRIDTTQGVSFQNSAATCA